MVVRSMIKAISMSVALSLALPMVLSAQFGGILKRRLERSAANQVAYEIETLMRDGVRCVFNDLRCAENAKAQGKTPVMTDANGKVITEENGKPITDPAAAAAKVGAPDPTAAPAAAPAAPAAPAAAGPAERPGTGAWLNYDFVPGDRVLFFDDFSADRVGDFPRRFELLAGNWEIAEWNGARYLRATSNGTIGTAGDAAGALHCGVPG